MQLLKSALMLVALFSAFASEPSRPETHKVKGKALYFSVVSEGAIKPIGPDGATVPLVDLQFQVGDKAYRASADAKLVILPNVTEASSTDVFWWSYYRPAGMDAFVEMEVTGNRVRKAKFSLIPRPAPPRAGDGLKS